VLEWLPTSEDQLRDALDQGILTEQHTLDFKRELPSSKGANKELARDLAQFAIDGGVLIIGVDDNAQLTPVDLQGLRERIDQVARDLVDEPLHVRIDTIPTAVDPATGYLLVTVPVGCRYSDWALSLEVRRTLRADRALEHMEPGPLLTLTALWPTRDNVIL
jgi:hypothetical protein